MLVEPFYKMYSSGEIVFLEGEIGDCAYIVKSGQITLSININGEEKYLAKLNEGELFGEMSLIDNHLRSATAISSENTELIVISREYFEGKLENSDKLINMLLRAVLDRYRDIRNRYEKLAIGIDIKEVDQCHSLPSYDQDIQFTTKRLQAENDLASAFESGHFELFYQPIISLERAEVEGCEALIRWRHPEKGIVPPGDFINTMEESGLIVKIGLWIIEEACNACVRFQKENALLPVVVSINLSGKQFETATLVEDVKAIYKRTQVDPRNIKLEITETILMSNPDRIAHILQEFKTMGSKIAIDDFGTGYSSFSYLHQFPIDTLKIDQSFVFSMIKNPKSMAIVKTLCILAQSLNMSIIAEGVEQAEDSHVLQNFKVDYGQGFYYSKPVMEKDFIVFLQKWTSNEQ